jgi:hypothetical protein
MGTQAIDTCLDTAAMRPLLQAVLPEFAAGRAVIERVQVAKARRSASRQRHPHPLTLCYELDVRDADGRRSTRRLFGKLHRDGASAQAQRGTAAHRVAALDLLLWAWPDDPGLPQLPRLLDARAVVPFWGEPAAAVQALRYEPERRATLRYDMPQRAAPSLFAKTFCDDRGEAIHRRFAHAWHQAQRDERAPLVARPLRYDAATRTLWQTEAGGTPLAALIGSAAPRLPALARALAQALATLHAAPRALAGPLPRDTAYWLAEVRRRCKKIARAVPHLTDRVERLAAAFEAWASALPHGETALIHGDLHIDQVSFDGERPVLFDFDEFSLGDPMEDLAGFVTRLAPGGAPAALGTHLLAAYAEVAGARYCRRRLHWHLALQQLLQASRAFVFQIADWRIELERRLARTEALYAAPPPEALP